MCETLCDLSISQLLDSRAAWSVVRVQYIVLFQLTETTVMCSVHRRRYTDDDSAFWIFCCFAEDKIAKKIMSSPHRSSLQLLLPELLFVAQFWFKGPIDAKSQSDKRI